MEKKLLDEVLACFENERRVLTYFKDKYAIDLLSRFVDEGKKVSEVKASPFSVLLHRPWVREQLAKVGGTALTREHLAHCWREDVVHFQQTLGLWGDDDDWRWNQTSRKGANLVVQLNFTKSHDRDYDKRLKGNRFGVYDASYHPVYKGEDRHTMAWARIDLSDDLSEALIEEIQTDWLRDANSTLSWAKAYQPCRCRACRLHGMKDHKSERKRFEAYHAKHIAPMQKIWDEAMLNAALAFLFDDVGVERVFYHDFDTGNALKHIGNWSKPPRSLYTKLPKRFGFTKTDTFPSFIDNTRYLRKRLKKVDTPMFYVMEKLHD